MRRCGCPLCRAVRPGPLCCQPCLRAFPSLPWCPCYVLPRVRSRNADSGAHRNLLASPHPAVTLPTTSLQLALIVLAALVGGMMNSIAGGGTLLTFPALVALGIP